MAPQTGLDNEQSELSIASAIHQWHHATFAKGEINSRSVLLPKITKTATSSLIMKTRQNNDRSVGCHRFMPFGEKRKKQSFSELLMAPQTGLEPVTS